MASSEEAPPPRSPETGPSAIIGRIEIVEGDITRLAVDAIVNAANFTLLGGGGVDGAIHRAAGPGLLAECVLLGGCRTGDAKMTRGHRLPAKWILHTVGPVWHGGRRREDDLLASCYRTCLRLAAECGAQSIAFPAISTGAYRFPFDRATRIALRETAGFLRDNDTPARVVFACFGADAAAAYRRALAELAAPG